MLKADGNGTIFNLSSLSKYNARNSTSEDYLIDAQPSILSGYMEKRFMALTKVMSYNASSKLKRLAIIGDSHAKDFVNMVAENNKLSNYQIRVHLIDYRCQMYIGSEDRSSLLLASNRAPCQNAYELKQAKPLIDQSDVVVLAAFWAMWSAQRINQTVSNLDLRKNQTLIVVGTKRFSNASPQIYRNMSYTKRQELRWKADPHFLALNDLLRRQLSRDVFVNILRFVCDANYSCPVFTPEDRLYSPDASHTSQSGARFVGALLFRHPPLNKL
jgi:hypothetical protein